MSVTVPQARAEEARAVMLELFPGGFEEVGGADGLELAAYTDAGGEERLWHAFGSAAAAPVPEDWPERWKRFHQPVRVGRLWVGPPWEEPPGDAIAVVVDPGRAFGTGGHPTTQLCLRLLQDVAPGSLLDVGCGSGVLAIAAAKLGYAPVLAVDADPHAVAAARANADANGATVTTELLAAGGEPLPESDVAVANIALDAVERLAPGLRSRVVLTSGYLASERPALRGYEHRERAERDGWAADVFAAAP